MVYSDKYETLVDGSILEGRDSFGNYVEASFSDGEALVNLSAYADHKTASWVTEQRLRDLYSSLNEVYPVNKLIRGHDGDNALFIDPDGWKGNGHDDFHWVEIPLHNSELYIQPQKIPNAESRPCEYSRVSISEPLNSTAAELLHPELSEKEVSKNSSGRIFHDIELFLENQ